MAKKLADYWHMIEIPVYILIAWQIVSVFIKLYSSQQITNILSWIGWVISIAVLGYIGYDVVENHKGNTGMAAKAGAYAGVLTGFTGAVINLVCYYLCPSIFDVAISQAMAQGVTQQMAQTAVLIGIYAGLVIGPVISGLIGAGIAALIAWFVVKNTR